MFGGVLAGWALLVSFLGITRHDFPSTPAAARGVMAISALLVAAAIGSAIIGSANEGAEDEGSDAPAAVEPG